MTSLIVAMLLSAQPDPKLAMPGLSGVNLAPNEAELYVSTLASELTRNGVVVLTSRDLLAVLGLERQKQLLGCNEAQCMTELIGALGAEGLVLGDIGKLGTKYVVQLKVLSTSTSETLALFSGEVADASQMVELLRRAAVVLQNQLAVKWNRPDLARALPDLKPATDRRWLAWVIGGVGLAATITGVVLSLEADKAIRQLQSSGATQSREQLVAIRNSGKAFEGGATVLLVSGGAAIVTGAVLFFLLGPGSPTVGIVPTRDGVLFGLSGVWP